MTAGHGEKLSRKQEGAIAALLTQQSIEAAAYRAGVATRTLKTWLKVPSFCAAYKMARRRLLDDALKDLQQLSCASAMTLGRNPQADRPGRPAKGRLQHPGARGAASNDPGS